MEITLISHSEVVFSAADIGGYQLKQRMKSDVLIECPDQQNAMALLLKEKKKVALKHDGKMDV